jgi:hypothetical protein
MRYDVRLTRDMTERCIAAFPAAVAGVGMAVSDISAALQAPSVAADHAQLLALR